MGVDLTSDGCRSRIARLRERLAELKLAGAILLDRRHVYYFSGLWAPPPWTPILFVETDGPAILSAPANDFPALEALAVDEIAVYEGSQLATFVDDQLGSALAPIQSRARRCAQSGPIGIDERRLAAPVSDYQDIRQTLWAMRRTKDEDEVGAICRLIQATEAAYAYVGEQLRPGTCELDLYSGIYAQVVRSLGEPPDGLGNDFRIGEPGGAARPRCALSGEVAVLDISVKLRGYRSDLCRSFIVGGSPSRAQQRAFDRIVETLAVIESQIVPGVCCRMLFQTAQAMLDGYCGWQFRHHLGHGIGLSQHERPRLNPQWCDDIQPGDVFTLEPGLYSPELRSGFRLEENYCLTHSRLVQLSNFPANLQNHIA